MTNFSENLHFILLNFNIKAAQQNTANRMESLNETFSGQEIDEKGSKTSVDRAYSLIV